MSLPFSQAKCLVLTFFMTCLIYQHFFSVPGKPRLVINHTQMNTALIQWYAPVETFGSLMGYRLKYGRKDVDILTTLEFSDKEDHFTAKEIHKGAAYVFKLSARNKVGFGEENIQEIIVPEDVPGGFPQNLHCDSMSSTSVQITWQPPILAERNGVITKYSLLYRDINNPYHPAEVPIVPADTTVTLTTLKADTIYDVKIRAYTSKGPGPFSPSVQFRTLPVDQGRSCLLKSLVLCGISFLGITGYGSAC